MHWQQTAVVRMENEFRNFQQIKRGTRQGFVLTPYFFFLYSKYIVCDIEGVTHDVFVPGITFSGRLVNNLHCANDTVLIENIQEDLQKLSKNCE